MLSISRPIAGYIPNRPAIKHLIEQRDMEAYLVPIAGTRILVPFRMTIPTPLGTGCFAGQSVPDDGATAAVDASQYEEPVGANPA